MKILQILPELNVGGVETGTVDFAKYLVAHGHQSYVISNGGRLVADLEAAGTKHQLMPVHKKNLVTMRACIKPLRQFIKDHQIDIVHVRSRVPAWIAYFAVKGTSATFITTCHGYYSNRWFSQVMGWGRRVIVPSQVIGLHMTRDFGVDENVMDLIPRSVDIERFRFEKNDDDHNPDEAIITMIGRITPLKGHRFFIDAMAELHVIYPRAKFWLIGDASSKKQAYKEELIDQVRRLGLESSVLFLGDRQDVPALLKKTDVLVLPTVTQEAFGRVIVEAQAAGVPVVATNVGGIKDIISDDETGLLVPPKDARAIFKATRRLLEDTILRHRCVRQARIKLEREYTLEVMSSRVLDVYEKCRQKLRILILKLGALGDVILITAALHSIRQAFPKAMISCVVGEHFHDVLKNSADIDELIPYQKQAHGQGWIKLFSLGRELARYKFDVVIDFQNNRRSHLLAWLSRSPRRIGFANGKWSFLLNDAVSMGETNQPPVDHQYRLLLALNITLPKAPRLNVSIPKNVVIKIENIFSENNLDSEKLIVGINMGASPKWLSKNWPIEYRVDLCQRLAQRHIQVILTGMPHEREAAMSIQQQCVTGVHVFVGQTSILELAECIKRCDVFITPDSAPLHLAAAVMTPVITFFGPTSANRHMPPTEKAVVLETQPNCAPCYSRICRTGTHECLKAITPALVEQHVLELLEITK